MAWKDITIEQYQQLYPILKIVPENPMEELEQQIEIISVLDGRPKEYYDDLTSKAFRLLCSHYSFIFTPPVPGQHPKSFAIKGVTFVVDYNPANVKERLKARDIIDLTTLAKDESLIVANMHRILAGYCSPSKLLGIFPRKVDSNTLMLQVDMQTATDITAFFLPLLENCLPVMVDYSQAQMETVNQMASGRTGDGN